MIYKKQENKPDRIGYVEQKQVINFLVDNWVKIMV